MVRLFYTLALIFLYQSASFSMDDYEKSELAGALGFSSMVLDSYYQQCFSREHRTDNNLNGINKLVSEKWHVNFLRILEESQKRQGRDYKQEASTLIARASEELGGCQSEKMNWWVRQVRKQHDTLLDKLHVIK